MKRLAQLLAAALLCHFIACKGNNEKLPMQDAALVVQKELLDKTAAADTAVAAGNGVQQKIAPAGNNQTNQDWDKKIIKTGNITMEVKKYAVFNEMLHREIKQLGGYVAQEEQQQANDRIENSVTVKVPVDQFDNAISRLTPGAEKIIEKKITAEDVTAEIVDTKSRLEAKKRVRDRYLDLLKQARNMKEILEVQNEVNGIQENIEAGAGRIGYLSHASAFSTINIRFYEVLPGATVNDDEPGYGRRMVESFKYGLRGFAEMMVLLVSFWPLWTVILVVWFFIRKRLKIVPVKNQKPVA